jgi:hypothetical protein
MNEHESIKEKLTLAASGSLDAMEYRQVQRHTAECEPCRRELERWSLYTQGLQRLPHPGIPAGLVERTQAQMLASHAAVAQHRKDALTSAWTLGALTAFGWASSFTFWNLVELFTGINALVWFLASTGLVWLTAGSAVVMFGYRRKVGRVL